MTLPKVSIIITTFNRSELLRRAVNSVISQTLIEWELIIWDDGSTDNTKLIVNSFHDPRINYSYSVNSGKSKALNHALKMVNGEYIAFLDDDDEWFPEKLSFQLVVMEKHPEIDLLFTNYNNINHYLSKEGQCFKLHKDELNKLNVIEIMNDTYLVTSGIPELLLKSNLVLPSSTLMKRACYDSTGNFNEDLRNAEDLEYWWRLVLSNIQFAYTSQIFVNRYKQTDSLSRENPISYLNHIKALGYCLDFTVRSQRTELIPKIKHTIFQSQLRLILFHARNRKWNEAFSAIVQSLNNY